MPIGHDVVAARVSLRNAVVSVCVGLIAAVCLAGVRQRIGSVPCPAGGCAGTALQRLVDCGALRSYLIEAIVEELVQARYGGWWRFGGPSGGAEGTGSAPTDFTSTNNQEVGVDELDIVKTDGWNLFVAGEQGLHVVRSWPAEDSALVASLQVPAYPQGLFLRQNVVALLSQSYGEGLFVPRWWTSARIDLVDVTDRSSPVLLRTVEVEGYPVAARMIDGQVYALILTWIPLPDGAWELIWRQDLGLPELPWDASDSERRAAMDAAKAILRPLVAELVAGTDVTTFLPRLADRQVQAGTSVERPLLGCQDLFRPFEAASYSVLTVMRFSLDDITSPIAATGILASGWTVYASARNLYVAETQPWWWLGQHQSTVIHKFQLAGTGEMRYTASGRVPGMLLDQFAMGEYEGFLRVASTEFRWWRPPEEGVRSGSYVTVLQDGGAGSLTTVGQLRDIAPGERIFASRFLGDKGFLITYEQIDPLFALDLVDPANPRIVGELEMPGVSTYLHPADDQHLLAVGLAPGSSGRPSEVAINVFDVANLTEPKLEFQHVVDRRGGEWAWSEALWDHHAFTFHRGVLSIPLTSWSGPTSFSGIVALAVDLDAGIRELGRVDHSDLAGDQGWAWARRTVYVEDYLYSLSNLGIKVCVLTRPEEVVAVVPFPRDAPDPGGILGAPPPTVGRHEAQARRPFPPGLQGRPASP